MGLSDGEGRDGVEGVEGVAARPSQTTSFNSFRFISFHFMSYLVLISFLHLISSSGVRGLCFHGSFEERIRSSRRCFQPRRKKRL